MPRFRARTLDVTFLQLGKQMLDNKNEVTLGEAHRHGGNDGEKDAQVYGVGNRLVAELLLLLGFDALVSGLALLLWAVDSAFRVRADIPNLAFLCALGNNGYGHGFAGLAPRPIPMLLCVRVLRLNLDVLVAGQGPRLRCVWVAGAGPLAEEICTSFGLPMIVSATSPFSLDW
jgi:hypothetical protein